MTSQASSPQAAGSKRAYQPDNEPSDTQSQPSHETPLASSAAATSAFRNVSACNRCRVRKNRCDQRLPACAACEKAKVRCVGFDPITKKEIPRSYVYYLETRLSYLETLLASNNISFDPPDAFEPASPDRSHAAHSPTSLVSMGSATRIAAQSSHAETPEDADKKMEDEKLSKIVSDIGKVAVQGASDRRYLGSTSGISFARVVLAAVKSSVNTSNSERSGSRPSRMPAKPSAGDESTIRDSYFGLSTRPTINEAPFPSRSLADKLVQLYFEHANCQIPILHRVDFLEMLDQAYSVEPEARTPRQLYVLNIVFAIGAGIIFTTSDTETNHTQYSEAAHKRTKISNLQSQPEEYHASAIVHLSSFLSSSMSADGSERSGGDLEDLQAVLLLASFALMRPVAPGLWYIVGVAMRLAVDLGLHFEDGMNLDGIPESRAGLSHQMPRSADVRDRGRREWTRDFRRRLWWCTYCLDRLVSTCVGRPFGITDTVVTTEFYSLLDDKYITKAGLQSNRSPDEPSYKRVAHHYLRLRLLQSEILQVLQYQQAQQARALGANSENQYLHKNVPSPFLVRHQDFRSWRNDIDQRLWEWKETAPEKHRTGVMFSHEFLELNYWQAVIMLYRNSLTVPDALASEQQPTEDVSTPTSTHIEDKSDQDHVFMKCAEAGQKTLKLYRQLHRRRLVNYTYLATHHLFMAGISFLYAVWHSPAVRSRLTLDDFDFTVLAATSVLGDLMEKCPPAEACRDAFERMSKATVQMWMSNPGFGYTPQARTPQSVQGLGSPDGIPMTLDTEMSQDSGPLSPSRRYNDNSTNNNTSSRRPPPRFDMDLHELFPKDLEMNFRPSQSMPRSTAMAQNLQQAQRRFGNQTNSTTARHTATTSQTPIPLQRGGSSSTNINFSQLSPHTLSKIEAEDNPYFNTIQNSYNPDFMSNLPGMEFLNSITSDISHHSIPNQLQPQPQTSSSATTTTTTTALRQYGVNNNSNENNSRLSNSHKSNNTLDEVLSNSNNGNDAKSEQTIYQDPNTTNSNPNPNPTTSGNANLNHNFNSEFSFNVGMGFNLNEEQYDWSDGQTDFDMPLDSYFFGWNGN